MAIPANSDFTYYTATPLTNTDWANNFHQIVTYLTNSAYDMSFNSLTTAGAVTIGGTATMNGATVINGALTVPNYTKVSYYLTSDMLVIGNGTYTPITGWTSNFDTLSEFNPTTGTWTPQNTGYYEIILKTDWSFPAGNIMGRIQITSNGAQAAINQTQSTVATAGSGGVTLYSHYFANITSGVAYQFRTWTDYGADNAVKIIAGGAYTVLTIKRII